MPRLLFFIVSCFFTLALFLRLALILPKLSFMLVWGLSSIDDPRRLTFMIEWRLRLSAYSKLCNDFFLFPFVAAAAAFDVAEEDLDEGGFLALGRSIICIIEILPLLGSLGMANSGLPLLGISSCIDERFCLLIPSYYWMLPISCPPKLGILPMPILP